MEKIQSAHSEFLKRLKSGKNNIIQLLNEKSEARREIRKKLRPKKNKKNT